MDLAPGTVLADKYRVDRLLGEGGMGVVVAATHLTLRQPIAVKLLRPEAMANPALVERFEREARAAARVHGDHVARVIDVGKLPGGLPYIVMEYLEGEDLERAFSRRGPLPVSETIDYILQTCEAIAEAHAAKIVHRDLKPANIFLSQRKPDEPPIVKVLDFGISKILEPETDSITKTSAVMGTAYYMSPEQLTNAKQVDTRTDIWSLGVILYELLGGTRPFEASTMPEVVALILQNDPPRLRRLRPEVTLDLEKAIFTCLRKVDDRYATVAELAQAIAPFGPREREASVGRIWRTLTGESAPPPVIPHVDLGITRIEIDSDVHSRAPTLVVDLNPPPRPTESSPLAISTAMAADSSGTMQATSNTLASGPPPALAAGKTSTHVARNVMAALAVAIVFGGAAYAAVRVMRSQPQGSALVGMGSAQPLDSTPLALTATPVGTTSSSASPIPSATPSSSAMTAPPPGSAAVPASIVKPRPTVSSAAPVKSAAPPPSSNPLDMVVK